MSTTTEAAKAKDKAKEEPRSLAEAAARSTVERLQRGYRENSAAAVAAVARLRREAGREPHASPTSWGLDDLETLTELRAKQREESDDTAHWFVSRKRRKREAQEEREDRAVHLAVTLWALHQQSVRDEAMHVRGWSLGRAVRKLAQAKGTEDDGQGAVENANSPLRQRFVRLGTSSDIDVLSRRLREIVLLLREARIPVDYGRLADELTRWQDGERQADVRRAWGREFHRVYRTAASEDDEDTPQPPTSDVDFVTDDAGE